VIFVHFFLTGTCYAKEGKVGGKRERQPSINCGVRQKPKEAF